MAAALIQATILSLPGFLRSLLTVLPVPALALLYSFLNRDAKLILLKYKSDVTLLYNDSLFSLRLKAEVFTVA